MSACITKTLALLNVKDHPSLDDIKQSTAACYSIIYEQRALDEFSARALAFKQQYEANQVLLWMVVCITVSGVILAGFQLFASYKVAVASGNTVGQNTELTVARNQIAIKSSVTGLSIMVLSFAFFLVFVRYVYKIDDPGQNLPPAGMQVGTIDRTVPKQVQTQTSPAQ